MRCHVTHKQNDLLTGVGDYTAPLAQFKVYAVRVGGSANTDLEFRLAIVDDAGAFVATLMGPVGTATAAGFQSDTAVTYPDTSSGPVQIELQYQAATGVTGTLYNADADMKETGSPPLDSETPAALYWGDGVATGAVCTGTDGWVPGFRNFGYASIDFPTNGSIYVAVRADGTGTTGFRLQVKGSTGTVWDTGVITTATWITTTSFASISGVMGFNWKFTKTGGGDGSVYCCGVWVWGKPGL